MAALSVDRFEKSVGSCHRLQTHHRVQRQRARVRSGEGFTSLRGKEYNVFNRRVVADGASETDQ